MMTDKGYLPNITCPRCRFRHPDAISCDEAERIAAANRSQRGYTVRLTWEQFIEVCRGDVGEAIESDMVELFDTGSVTVKVNGQKYVLAITVDREYP